MMKRRDFLTALAALTAPLPASAQPALRRPIPKSGETIPVIGMGTWLTFDVGEHIAERAQRKAVLERFFAAGGGMIDSSPMYGRAERLLGDLLSEMRPQVDHAGRLFSATKVWSAFERVGPTQMAESLRLWKLARFDLMLIHNLLNWRAHSKSVRAFKEQGRCRYIGVTTSHGNKHDEMQAALKSEPWDFMQITYNLADQSAEPLMHLAAERGVAVVINRPFDGGLLFNRAGQRPLPGWAAELGCSNWAQAFLKWVVSHPAVTCAIPATRNPAHMIENMGARFGPLPDAALRRRMLENWRRD
jgi:diketogulonate reductase-like aldo/keto reductase